MYTKTQIIAEPAIYWHGDRILLNKTITAAAGCDCEFFKLQWYDTKFMGNAWKHKKPFYDTCMLSVEDVREVKNRCDQRNMTLLVTANQPTIIHKMNENNFLNIKIASGQIEEKMIDTLAEYDNWDRVFVSTGMLAEPERLGMLRKLEGKVRELVIFHCVSLYPHDDCETNMKRISSLKAYMYSLGFSEFKMGYSDHSKDDMACLVAMSYGIDYLERHFKLPESYGPTSNIASMPEEMKRLSMYRDRISMIRGDGDIDMNKRELPNLTRYSSRWLLV
jgi:sialic acid synthase SpsE